MIIDFSKWIRISENADEPSDELTTPTMIAESTQNSSGTTVDNAEEIDEIDEEDDADDAEYDDDGM